MYCHRDLKKLYPEDYKTITQALYKRKHLGKLKQDFTKQCAPITFWTDEELIEVAEEVLNLPSNIQVNRELWKRILDEHLH